MHTSRLLAELQSKATFPDSDFPDFLALFQPLILRKKDHLYCAGEVVPYAAFVVQGCVRHYYANSDGNERTVMIAEENWWVGDLTSFLERTATKMNLQAIEDSELLIINREHFQYGLDHFTGFREYYTKGTQKTYSKLQEQVGESTADTAEARYRKLLEERPTLLNRVPMHYIASYLGITPESLSRVRKKISH